MERDPDPAAVEALAGVEPLEPARDVRVRDRCLATNDAETYSKARDLVPELSVELVEEGLKALEEAKQEGGTMRLDDFIRSLSDPD